MHHAYIYYGSLALLPALAKDARERFQFEGEHNPDVQVREYEKFGIEEARALSSAGALRSVSGRSLSIIGVSQINHEAQQALLKLFEEPQKGAIFILLAPHGSVIATLRSRLMAYPTEMGEKYRGSTSVKTFLASSPKARSLEITALLKDEEGTRERVREFLAALEEALYSQLQKSKGRKDIREGLEDIAKIRSYANDRSPSLKMLLEHLALSLPKL